MSDNPAPESAPASGRSQLLFAAFEDTEATIRATDAKASIALIVHGFLFAGLLGVLSGLGPPFHQGSCYFRALVISLTVLATIAFVVSIVQLLRCVTPAPAKVIPDTPHRGVFYLGGKASAWNGATAGILSFEALKARLEALTDADVEDELTAELLKVSAIRARKVALAASGLTALGIEVGLALTLLSSLAIDRL